MIPSKNPIWADKGRFCLYPAVVKGEQENKKYLIFLKKVLTKTISFIIIIYVAEEHSKQQKEMRQ